MKWQGRSVLFVQMIAALIVSAASGAELRVPGFTAYLDPDGRGARVSQRSGVVGWTDPAVKVLWFGEIKTPGKLDCSVVLRLAKDATSKLRLTVAGQSREATVQGAGVDPVTANLGSFDIPQA